MKGAAYCLFETPLGTCGIAWTGPETSDLAPVVTFLQLPEATRGLTERRLAARSKGRKAPKVPPAMAGIVARIQRHLKGDLQDFQDIAIDLDGTAPFTGQVYEAARKIPAGQTRTYGGLAAALNRPQATRAVGRILANNPIPLIVPCHRVLAAGHKPGGFSAPGGVALKARLLAIEGVLLETTPTLKTKRDLVRLAALLKKQDPHLTTCLERSITFQLRQGHSPYATLMEAVVYQQLSPKAASTIFNRVLALYPGSEVPDPRALLKTSDESLRNAGLSKAKVKALKDIARKTLDGTVPSAEEIVSLTNEEIIKRLTSIYGVGLWTVEMMLIFNLGRPDVFPVDDYALRKQIAEFFGMKDVPTPKQVTDLGDAWRPYRTVATLYLWNNIDP